MFVNTGKINAMYLYFFILIYIEIENNMILIIGIIMLQNFYSCILISFLFKIRTYNDFSSVNNVG